MKLKEVFDQLTFGELSQLSIGGGEAGYIPPERYNMIVAHINLGLNAIYKRFHLKEGNVLVELDQTRTDYPIQSRFAVTGRGSREPVRYIRDSLQSPFRDDLLKMERVYASTGYEFRLNDIECPYSLTTPSISILRVPRIVLDKGPDLADELRTDTLRVVYRASHPKIMPDDDCLDPEAITLELPYSHLEPLLLFVASRAHTPTGMVGEFNPGNNFMQKYEMACRQLEEQGLEVDQGAQSDRLRIKGFV